jgi:hypothetical protein
MITESVYYLLLLIVTSWFFFRPKKIKIKTFVYARIIQNF